MSYELNDTDKLIIDRVVDAVGENTDIDRLIAIHERHYDRAARRAGELQNELHHAQRNMAMRRTMIHRLRDLTPG